MIERQEIALRAAKSDDAAAIAALIQAAFAPLVAISDPKPSAMRESADSVAATLAAGGGAVAMLGDRLVGAVLWEPHVGGLYFGRLAVAPDCQGHGIARALLAEVEAEARRRGLTRLLLSTRLVWTSNRRLFASLGFVETAQHAHPGYAAPTFVDMEKPIA